MAGFVTLGDIGERRAMLDVACERCGRRGRLSVRRLIDAHGAALPMPAPRRVVAADCPRMRAEETYDPCGVRFPGLGA